MKIGLKLFLLRFEMYRSVLRCHIVRRILSEKKPYSSPLCTAATNIPRNPRIKDEVKEAGLQERVLQWDEKLQIPDPPPLKALVDFLVRRRTLSSAKGIKLSFHRLAVRTACGILGLKDAHERMCELHANDPVNNCWYAPANHGDTFGIRHDETHFHQDIIPSQPVTSYGVLIRGSPRHAGTSVKGGIAENEALLAVDNPVSSKNHGVMVTRAVSLIDGLMKARDFYNSAEFDQDTIKGTPLSMQWYNYIFSCSMQFHPGSIERYKAPEEHSRHIIVMVRGNMYKLDIIRANEICKRRRITINQLKKQIGLILEMDATRDIPSTPMAVITSLTPTERCQEEQRLKCLTQRNATNLALIRDALFILALDPEDFPRSANEAMYALYSGNFINRWYDKSVQLVVFGNGVAGFVNNYLAGMTGTVGTNFVRIAVANERSFEEEITDDADNSTYPEPHPITWDDTTDEYFRRSIDYKIQTSRESGPFKPFSTDVFKICRGFSFEKKCKSHGVTPGSLFQAGIQLALGMTAGRPMSVNEVVSIRNFRFGGMTFMDSSTADMKHFVQQACKSRTSGYQTLTKQEQHLRLQNSLKRALRSYMDEVLRYKKGEINLWHLDSLYRTLGLANRLPFRNTPSKLILSLKGLILRYLRAPGLDILPPQIAENVTSNPCWYPEIEAIGRPGVKCILPPNSMALHYMFGRNAISITVNANPQHPCYGKEVAFVKELEESLHLVQHLLDS